MKCIIVIKGVDFKAYEDIKTDLTNQIKNNGWSIPLFCCLPAEYSEIEVVWLDEEMEKELFQKSLDKVKHD